MKNHFYQTICTKVLFVTCIFMSLHYLEELPCVHYVRVGIHKSFPAEMVGHCLLSTAYSQIRVWLVQSQDTFITPPESVHPPHSLMPLPKIGSLLGQRLGHRLNTTTTLCQCLVHTRITWRNCDRHASFSGQTPTPSPLSPLLCYCAPVRCCVHWDVDKTENNP